MTVSVLVSGDFSMSSEVNQLNGSAIPVHDESHCVEKLVEARLVLPPMVVAAATSFLVSWPTKTWQE